MSSSKLEFNNNNKEKKEKKEKSDGDETDRNKVQKLQVSFKETKEPIGTNMNPFSNNNSTTKLPNVSNPENSKISSTSKNSEWYSQKNIMLNFLSKKLSQYSLDFKILITSEYIISKQPYCGFSTSREKYVKLVKEDQISNAVLNWEEGELAKFKAEVDSFFEAPENCALRQYYRFDFVRQIEEYQRFTMSIKLREANSDYFLHEMEIKKGLVYVILVFPLNCLSSVNKVKEFYSKLNSKGNKKGDPRIQFIPIISQTVQNSEEAKRIGKILKAIGFAKEETIYLLEKTGNSKTQDKKQAELSKLLGLEEYQSKEKTPNSQVDDSDTDPISELIKSNYNTGSSLNPQNLKSFVQGKCFIIDKDRLVQEVVSPELLIYENIESFLEENSSITDKGLTYSKLKETLNNSVMTITNKANQLESSYDNLAFSVVIRAKKSRVYSKEGNLQTAKIFHPQFLFSSKSKYTDIYSKLNKQLTAKLSNSTLISSFIEEDYYNNSYQGIKSLFSSLKTSNELSHLDYSTDYKVTRKYHRNLEYKPTKNISMDITARLNSESKDIDKSNFSKRINVLFSMPSQPKLDYLKFLPEIYEKFDDKESSKPKVVVVFYTTDDEDQAALLEDFLTELIEILEDDELKGKFHEIYFRRKDTEDCVTLENNDLEIPEILKAKSKKIVALPKKLKMISIQNLCPDFDLILTNSSNQVIYSGLGLELNLYETLNNIASNNPPEGKGIEEMVFKKNLPCSKEKTKKLIEETNRVVEFIGSELEAERIFYKPLIEFSYRKHYRLEQQKEEPVFYSQFKFVLTVKNMSEEISRSKEVKQYKKLLTKEYNGRFVFDASSETSAVLEYEGNKLDYPKQCPQCQKEDLSVKRGFFYDEIGGAFYCYSCESQVNQPEKMFVHPNNFLYIKSEGKKKASRLLNEIFTANYEKYRLAETNLEPEDDVNCSICAVPLIGDDTVWLSLIHLYNDFNLAENLFICNRKCFKGVKAYGEMLISLSEEVLELKKRETSDSQANSKTNLKSLDKEKGMNERSKEEGYLRLFFNESEVRRILVNCLDLKNLALRKIVLPTTGY